jgi:hypothetical protein
VLGDNADAPLDGNGDAVFGVTNVDDGEATDGDSDGVG